MEEIIKLLTTHWIYFAIILGCNIAIGVLDAITKHWSQHTGLKKVALLLTEILMIITSVGATLGKTIKPKNSIKPSSGNSK